MTRVSQQTLIDRSVKRIGKVEPIIKEKAIEIIKKAYRKDINVQFSDGLRTNAQQQALYDQGRSTPGNIVTNAKPGTSYHNYGLAIDFFLVTEDGKHSMWSVNNDWLEVAKIGKSLGFEWGGDWTKFKDYPHLQLTGGLSIKELQSGKRPTFSKSNSNKKPKIRILYVTKPVMHGSDVKEVQELLAKHYFYPEKGAKNNGVDGYYGLKTENAVKRFQIMNGLKVDGVVGKNTLAKLKK